MVLIISIPPLLSLGQSLRVLQNQAAAGGGPAQRDAHHSPIARLQCPCTDCHFVTESLLHLCVLQPPTPPPRYNTRLPHHLHSATCKQRAVVPRVHPTSANAVLYVQCHHPPPSAILDNSFQASEVVFTPHQSSSNLALDMDSEPIPPYGLRGKTRAIAAVSDPSSSSVNSQFLAGTCSVRAGNEVPLHLPQPRRFKE